ncbi:MAG TPA: hypothetical protein VMU34_14470 [Mycobacterium sp.]|nr:hypothetical protein [Mycobacterium sp.]
MNTWTKTRAAALIAAALVAAAPAGVAQADICGGVGPGIIGAGPCYPPDNNNNDVPQQSSVSSWPPGADYGSGDAGGNASSAPIVPAANP